LPKEGLSRDLRPAALLTAGLLPVLAMVLRAGAVMADCADAPTQVNASQSQAGGVVVAAPGLRGALMGKLAVQTERPA
jgi:hypothetical protein